MPINPGLAGVRDSSDPWPTSEEAEERRANLRRVLAAPRPPLPMQAPPPYPPHELERVMGGPDHTDVVVIRAYIAVKDRQSVTGDATPPPKLNPSPKQWVARCPFSRQFIEQFRLGEIRLGDPQPAEPGANGWEMLVRHMFLRGAARDLDVPVESLEVAGVYCEVTGAPLYCRPNAPPPAADPSLPMSFRHAAVE